EAALLLASWHALEPNNPWPLLRKAVVEQQRGNVQGQAEAIQAAMRLTRGRTRAAVAFLGVRLQLAACVAQPPAQLTPAVLQPALAMLQDCLKGDPDHEEALWALAALRSLLGDEQALAAQAPEMNRPTVQDPRFHYMAAVCHLAARDYPRMLEAGKQAAA